MYKTQAKEKIKKLVERYEKLSDAEKRKYNEQQTKDHFIRPLFEALGWDFEHEVWPETDVSGKRVDYAFKIDGNTKFYMEAKAIPVNLDEERWAEQAINYSWHKSVPWVVLTDFEAIKVFNTEWDEPNIQSCRYIEITWTEYLTSEKLWWLSREAFQKGILDKKADEVGKRPKRIIDDQLSIDLIRWRELLRKDLEGFNPKINPRKISKYVQKILDRLIFIRTLEDRKIEDVILQPLVRDWQEKGSKANQLLFAINKVFHKMSKTYDSGLFEDEGPGQPYDYLGDKLDAMDGTFVEIISEMYKTEGKGIRYNFADIPADIFGSIYEQYLGHIQQEDAKEKKTSKRKSQGIYYTPRYIVDYIVQNTLGEILKNQTPSQIKNLKILDPACGSGSFLIAAYQSLLNYWEKQKGEQIREKNGKFKDIEKAFKKRNGDLLSAPAKMTILLNNIFGADLDEEAVELAKLNLLLKMVGDKIKLPKLANNIQEGNSLISGSESELKKYFGSKWKEKKPFAWGEKFRDALVEKELCAYHITWATHNSRVSERMIEYKVKKGPGLWLEEKDEIKITGFIRDIVKEDGLRVLSFNICGDHVHMLLVCAPDEVANIARKLKGKSAQKYKEYLKIGKEEKFHLWAQKFSKTIIRPSREGKNGLREYSHFHTAIEYINRNREKHNLPGNKGLLPIIADMVWRPLADDSLPGNKGLSSSGNVGNKGLQPHVADMVCDIDSALASQYKGGFDVIIGNPPYIRPHKLENDFKKYAWDHYKVFKAKSDIYAIFMQKAIDLLKDNGLFSFIVSNTWLSLQSFNSLRKYILDKCCILSLVILPSKVFEDATVETMIFVLKKEKDETKRNNNKVIIYNFDGSNFLIVNRIKQTHFLSTHLNIFDVSCNNSLSSKIKKASEPLQNYINFYYGLKTGDDDKFITKKPTTKKHKKLLRRSDFKRYSIYYNNNYVWYVPDIMRKNKITARPGDKKRFESPKILIQDINKKLIATFDDNNYYVKDALMLHQRGKTDLKFILALINSKLLNYWYAQQFKTLSVAKNAFLTLPIYKINFSNKKEKAKHDKLVTLADKMLKLNKELQKLDPIMDDKEYKEIEAEIERTDEEIDERVFELYGLTEGERKLIK